jgi:hypothetical protein
MVHIGTVYWGQNVASVPYWTRPPRRNSTLRKALEWVDPEERANSVQVLEEVAEEGTNLRDETCGTRKRAGEE